MRGREESVALRSLTAAVEAHTQFLRLLIDKVDAGFAGMDAKMDAGFEAITTRLDEFHAEFATHRHGDDGEVI